MDEGSHRSGPRRRNERYSATSTAHSAEIDKHGFLWDLVRLAALARAHLSQKLSRRVDPGDVVLSAYRSFFIRARDGRFQPGADDDLWPLLVTVTLRKVHKQVRLHAAERRDLPKEKSALDPELAELVSSEPSPEVAAIAVDEVQQLLAGLSDLASAIVIELLQGEDSLSVARKLDCSERTVRRVAAQARERLAAGISHASTRDVAHLAQQWRGQVPCDLDIARSFEHEQMPTHRLEQFTLHKMIGQGSFSKVFRATERATLQIVAVKFLRKSLWQDTQTARGLKREFAALNGLRHPNLVRVLGWGTAPSGAIFVLSEWIDGQTLDAWLEQVAPSVAEVMSVLLTTGEALAAAHERGVLHGDLKPQNVMRERNGRIVLTDFGMARWFQRVDDQPPRGGSAGFLSPEQISAAFGDITEQTDVYAWGALAYALLTGLAPMHGRDLPEIISSVLSSAPPPTISAVNSQVPADIESLILKRLSKSPAERPTNVAAMCGALRGMTHAGRYGPHRRQFSSPRLIWSRRAFSAVA